MPWPTNGLAADWEKQSIAPSLARIPSDIPEVQESRIDEAESILNPASQHRPRSLPQESVEKSYMFDRRGMLGRFLTLLIVFLYESLSLGCNARLGLPGASATWIPPSDVDRSISRRSNSPTDVCNRWSHQSAVVNGTLYLYGGNSIQNAGQKDNTWNNDFLSLSLTEDWDISDAKLIGLPQPSGPPAVSNGYLWNSYDSLYLYGGEFSDRPFETPQPYSLWEYHIKNVAWTEHRNPKTTAGNNSDSGDQPVQRAAEGAGISVPELGRGWYFGGHLDEHTTPGWSNLVARQYLKSLIEYTFPGYTNDGVKSLSDGKTAGDDGVWRNVTQGGIQDSHAFSNRADGVLVHVPGFGRAGIILSLAGGNNESFVSLALTHCCFRFGWWHSDAR